LREDAGIEQVSFEVMNMYSSKTAHPIVDVPVN